MAIKYLKIDTEIVVPPADKGNAVVMMDKLEYSRKLVVGNSRLK